MKVGILVSGGDAPGINSVIYATWVEALKNDISLVGIQGGYNGIFRRTFMKLSYLPSETSTAAGCLLTTGRSAEFMNQEKRKEAMSILHHENIDALIVIGGNGSLSGAALFNKEGFPAVGIPATIDGDISGTEKTLGFSSAIQEIVQDIRALQATASAYPGRLFLIEVLGGKSGSLTLTAGLAANADLILVPELPHTYEDAGIAAAAKLKAGSKSLIAVICEGSSDSWESGQQGCCFKYGREINKKTGIRPRYTMTGYGLRGVLPDAFDCLLGKQFAHLIVNALQTRSWGTMSAIQNGHPKLHPITLNCQGLPLDTELELAAALNLFPEHLTGGTI